MRMLPVNKLIPILLVVAVAGAVSFVVADQVVYFTNGKAMMVKKIVDEGDGVTILELDGGGRIGVPSEQITRIEEFAVSPSTSGQARQAPPPLRTTQAPPAAGRTAAPDQPTQSAAGQNDPAGAAEMQNLAVRAGAGLAGPGIADPGSIDRPGGPAAEQERPGMLAARGGDAARFDTGSGRDAAGQGEIVRPRRSSGPRAGAQIPPGPGRGAARAGATGQLQRPGARTGRGFSGRNQPRGSALIVGQGSPPRGPGQGSTRPQGEAQTNIDPRDEMFPEAVGRNRAGPEADEAAPESTPAQGGSSDGTSSEEN